MTRRAFLFTMTQGFLYREKVHTLLACKVIDLAQGGRRAPTWHARARFQSLRARSGQGSTCSGTAQEMRLGQKTAEAPHHDLSCSTSHFSCCCHIFDLYAELGTCIKLHILRYREFPVFHDILRDQVCRFCCTRHLASWL